MELNEALAILAEKFRSEARTEKGKKEDEAAVVIIKSVLNSLERIAVVLERIQP